MTIDDMVGAIAQVVPDFNNYVLRDMVKEHIDASPEFPAIALKESFKYVDADLKFLEAEIVSPEARVTFELNAKKGKTRKPRIQLSESHLQMVRYAVRFGKQVSYVTLYAPYIHNHMLMIKGRQSIVRKVVLEKTFSRMRDKSMDGLSISPIRVHLRFDRSKSERIVSYTSKKNYFSFLVASILYHGGYKKTISELLALHYMLAKFGFVKTLKRFGLSTNDVSFVTEIADDTDKYEYFAAKKFNPRTELNPGLFVKVKNSVLTEALGIKFVVNLVYLLSRFERQTYADVMDPHAIIWQTFLGIITWGDWSPKAHTNALTHLKSVDTFIDPLTQQRFNRFGVPIKDIYDVLVYVFVNIDRLMVQNLAQDIYDNRVDVSNGIFVQSYATPINKNFYELGKQTNITLNDVNKALKIDPMIFKNATKSRNGMEKHYIAPPEIVGDCFLFSGGLTKVRLEGSPKQRFHPSWPVVESINAFVGQNIGLTGYLNPYIPTDANAAIVHPDYARDSIDLITPWLPK